MSGNKVFSPRAAESGIPCREVCRGIQKAKSLWISPACIAGISFVFHIRYLSRKVPTASDSEILRTRICPKSHSSSTRIPARNSSPSQGGASSNFLWNLNDDHCLLFFPFSNIFRALIQCFEVSALGFLLFEGDHFSGEFLKSSYNMKCSYFTQQN